MKSTVFILLVAIATCFVTKSVAQSNKFVIKNGFAIGGGITQFDIITDNFETTKGEGWIVGMSATVMPPYKAYGVSYGMQLSENTIGISGYTSLTDLSPRVLEYKIFTAQVAFLCHVKLISDFVTFDVGPMLQYNSDLELKEDAQESYLIKSYNNLTANDITEISNVNFNGAVGFTVGLSHFKVKAQYIYGVTNMLNKLNSNNDLDLSGNDRKFKGNQSMLAFTAMITF
ncbi:hypothetical protein [Lacinutrix sp. Hel_I_90]|uniref:hypothetical protein n=1 Tax=Lacinutrix sp. Hel_I_90 TaxID=1249999 RepID=UPI0005C84A5C|nr:hypothetical protein [Lacinutrix sp. Hel_I_90]